MRNWRRRFAGRGDLGAVDLIRPPTNRRRIDGHCIGDFCAVMVYDARHDVVLVVLHSHFDDAPDKLGVYTHDPKTNSWLNERLTVPERLCRNGQPKNGFFDSKLGALFLHSAGDSDDDATIWVYRYKRPE